MKNQIIEFISNKEFNNLNIQFSKFGGSSFKPFNNINAIAEHLQVGIAEGKKQIVFCSAPGDLTQSLKSMASAIEPDSHSQAIDGLITCSDLVGAYLFQHAMEHASISNKLLTGLDNGIVTDDIIGGAHVKQVRASVIFEHLKDVDVLILPGGQGASFQGVRWLGKNSSDLSCILYAVAAQQSVCAIHSDVDSVFDADPNVILGAKPYRYLDYDTVITAASLGAKVLHYNAVQVAKNHNLEIVCKLNRAPFTSGTIIGNYKANTITVTDKKALLLDIETYSFEKVEQYLKQQNILAFSREKLNILLENQLLIPMAYLNYLDMLKRALPSTKIDGQHKVVIHLALGNKVLKSMFTSEESLKEDAESFHYNDSLINKVAHV